jgi:5-methylcytosine-specific restriction protein A
MPMRSPAPCRRCPTLTTEGLCSPCRKKAQQLDRQTRGSAHARGYTAAWQAYSRRYRYEHPWCVLCLKDGKQRITQQVDHISPVSGPQDPSFWDPMNHQALCTPCHSRKTVTTDQRGLTNAPLSRPVSRSPWLVV